MLYRLPPPNRSSLAVHDDTSRTECDGFAGVLREFIASRLDRIDPFRESAEYSRRHGLAQRLHDELEALLPPGGRAKLREYADAMGSAHSLETELLCERAFLDGMRLVTGAVRGKG